MTMLNYADPRDELSFHELLIPGDIKRSNRRQEMKILSYVESMVAKINNTYSINLSEEERDRRVDDIIKYYRYYIDKIQVNRSTMYSLLVKISKNKKDKIASRLLDTLYSSHRDSFLSCFRPKIAHF